MTGEDACKASAAARACLTEVRQSLLHATPENLNGCLELLQTAIHHLTPLKDHLTKAAEDTQPGVRREAEALFREVADVNALFHSAGRFYLGWAAFLTPVATEYGAHGQRFPLSAHGRVSIDG